MSTLPSLRDAFPRMEVETTQGTKILPDDYSGKWFVLFSHPGDFTPVCTSEFESFAMSEEEFTAANTELIGLSLDSVEDHKKWIEWINEHAPVKVNYPVVGGESSKVVADQLGMVHEKYGAASVRTVFIVDPQGVLRLMMYYPMEIGRNISEVLRSVKALQIVDENKVSTPADFPNNKWIGEEVVLVPGARNEEQKVALDEAIKAGTVESKADWFNYKKL